MRKSWIRRMTMIGLAAAVMSGSLIAQAGDTRQEKKAAKEGEEYYHGVVSAVDFKTGSVTIKQKEAGSMTFQTTPGSRYYVKQKKQGVIFSDFHVGDKVEVWYVVEHGTSNVRVLAEEGSHVESKMKKEAKER